MISRSFGYLVLVGSLCWRCLAAQGPVVSRSASQCEPFESSFAPGDVSGNTDTSFLALTPSGSYSTSDHKLQLYLERPQGKITTKNGVNDKLGEGATVNSTFTFLYGRVTYTIAAPPVVSGVVTAAILIADEGDEVDVELLGGDPSHWQTNVYAPNPKDQGPLWGVFGEIEDYPDGGDGSQSHEYTVDWNAERIVWSVDGQSIRTITKGGTEKNGALHYPSHPTRLSLGIWDASSPVGTAQWAKGPIDWSNAPERITATITKVSLECPY
ncbi:concanavalin A-like lectin/glucanase [Rhodofomes roseus]|uniref:Concanavalin A-like lectin/glucanase n=1 Tax=Rhodofomes roseus TaxID=34475 RepID=A0ABQ8K063_9APHY|nr:concanavalin A-like lectin/glucanase [Rhodofomes roseus]KAH9829986.1 concanavalin A-like lectin/glucanase [Rhodofomes roseus]